MTLTLGSRFSSIYVAQSAYTYPASALAVSLSLLGSLAASLPTRTRLAPLPLRCAQGGWLRPQAEEALRKAAEEGDLATLTRLVEEGVNLEATTYVSDILPAAPCPLRPSPSALTARHPCCPALTSAIHRVWCRRRASVGRLHGPHVGVSQRQARLPRVPHRQGRQPECPGRCAPRPCCGVMARGVGV